jgi:biofilm PGA synthesis N-glycosyltransferase PgaC
VSRRRPAYALISPCLNEARYLHDTIQSILRQTYPPTQWVMVDDGSTDASPLIMKEYSARYPWITTLSLPTTERRNVGTGAARAINAGLASIAINQYEYVGVFDLDILLPPMYYERVIQVMGDDTRLGSFTGKPYHYVRCISRGKGNTLKPETIGDDISVGATKFYRTGCFEDIGGITEQFMWDVIDCHMARIRGWKVKSSDEEALRFIHLRPMGSGENSLWTGRMKHGEALYYIGASPVFAIASAANRVKQRPVLISSLGIIAGYLSAAMRRVPRYQDREFRQFLRKYHRLCLTRGKARAVSKIEREYEPRWRPRKRVRG